MIGFGNSMFLATHGILAKSASGGGVDPDAQAFITAASITDPTQQSAINQLVVDLKGYNIWTKFKAIYPIVGGTSSTHKWNLKDPRDLDAAFRLTFSNGWTHSSNGMTPSNAYADTFLTPSLAFNTTTFNHLSYYSRSNTAKTSEYVMGAFNGIGNHGLIIRRDTNLGLFVADYATSTSFRSASGTGVTDGRGLFLGSQTGANAKLYRNGSVIYSNTGATLNAAVPNNKIFIGALNETGIGSLTDKQCAFASMGQGLTDTEAANFYTAVQAYQTTLGRSIGTQTVSDADAQAFVTNAGIVDQVEANAVNNLVIGLKADGLWSKFSALYPFVGGTSTTNSYNLKNTAQYQITWYGGVTHSYNGITGNGTNGYGDTFLANNVMAQNDAHISVYSRTNVAATVCDIGSWNGGFGSFIYSRNSLSNFEATLNSTINRVQQANSDSRGFYLVTRKSGTSQTGQKNSTQYVTNISSNTHITTSFKLLRPGEYNGEYSPRNLAFASIGDGLTDAEALNLNSRVTTFQTALGRQV